MKKLFLFLIAIITFQSAQAQLLDTTYIWPTNSGEFLSSTFGETRSAHFHAGLDIKTWGREGYKVFATRGGILSRLAISNRGYGKVIYLKHSDDTYTVYAHLSRFTNIFQVKADSIRFLDYSYEMDSDFEKDSIFISQGDVIGYTGSTGIGPPHLHYEIRNSENEPINPLRTNLTVKDTISPTFRDLLIEPLSPQSVISGKNIPQTFRAKRIAPSTYNFGIISTDGPIGIAVNVYDGADEVYNKYAVYELLLVQESDTLFSQKIKRFNFSQAETMFLDRVSSPSSRRRNFQRLFVPKVADHPFVTQYIEHDNVTYNVPYTIIAKDYFGNTSTAVVQFAPDSSFIQEKKTTTVAELKTGFWNQDWIAFSDSTYLDLRNFNQGALWDTTLNQRIIDLKMDANTTLSRLYPKTSATITSPDLRVSTRFSRNMFFEATSVLQQYRFVDDTIELELIPNAIPLRSSFGIELYMGDLFEDYSRTNLYRYYPESKRLNFVYSEVRGNTLLAQSSSFGIFRVAQDTIPPIIQKPKFKKLDTGERVIVIYTSDDLSGIDFRSAVFIVNGIQGIAEYDYENDEFTFYNPKLRSSKRNAIYFKVKDRAGNTAEGNFQL